MSYSACLQTASINLGCASNVGGIKKAYLVAGTISGITYNASSAITGITGSGTIYTYEVQKQTSSLTETFNSSLENGTLYYSQELLLNFHKIDQDKRNQVKLMAQNRGLKAFVEDPVRKNSKNINNNEILLNNLMHLSKIILGVSFSIKIQLYLI